MSLPTKQIIAIGFGPMDENEQPRTVRHVACPGDLTEKRPIEVYYTEAAVWHPLKDRKCSTCGKGFS